MDPAPGIDAPARSPSGTEHRDDPFPDLVAERRQLTFARRARDRMIDRLERVDPASAADDITAEYIEMTVGDALADLNSPGAGDFFGRIDTDAEPERTASRVGPAGQGKESWYIGRRHIEDDHHDPVVVDWRAPIAAPFYRATGADPLGVTLRRRFTMDQGEINAYLDEHTDADPELVADELLIEEISIDGMCGVY